VKFSWRLGVDVDAVGVLTTLDQPQQQTVSYSKRLFASTSTPSLQLNFTEDWKQSYVLLLFLIYLLIYFTDFCQTNYLNIYWTDLRQIFRFDRTIVVEVKR